MKGSVTRIAFERGYSFLRGEDERDYFAHASQVEDFQNLDVGQVVEFVASDGPKGPRAENVVIIS